MKEERRALAASLQGVTEETSMTTDRSVRSGLNHYT